MDGYLDWLLGSKFNIRTLENEPFFFFFFKSSDHFASINGLSFHLSSPVPLCAPCSGGPWEAGLWGRASLGAARQEGNSSGNPGVGSACSVFIQVGH